MHIVAVTCKLQLLVRSAVRKTLLSQFHTGTAARALQFLSALYSWHFSICTSCSKFCKAGVAETLSAAWLLMSPSKLSYNFSISCTSSLESPGMSVNAEDDNNKHQNYGKCCVNQEESTQCPSYCFPWHHVTNCVWSIADLLDVRQSLSSHQRSYASQKAHENVETTKPTEVVDWGRFDNFDCLQPQWLVKGYTAWQCFQAQLLCLCSYVVTSSTSALCKRISW